MDDEKVYLLVETRPETKLEAGVRKVNTVLAVGAMIITVAPIIVYGIKWCVETIKYKYKIKKGLKDGSVIEIDGKYYEVNVEESKSSD